MTVLSRIRVQDSRSLIMRGLVFAKREEDFWLSLPEQGSSLRTVLIPCLSRQATFVLYFLFTERKRTCHFHIVLIARAQLLPQPEPFGCATIAASPLHPRH